VCTYYIPNFQSRTLLTVHITVLTKYIHNCMSTMLMASYTFVNKVYKYFTFQLGCSFIILMHLLTCTIAKTLLDLITLSYSNYQNLLATTHLTNCKNLFLLLYKLPCLYTILRNRENASNYVEHSSLPTIFYTNLLYYHT
jgi:hypothetical protein